MRSAMGLELGLGQAWRLGVAPGAISLWRSSRWRGPAWTLLGEQAFVPDAADGDFAALGQALLPLLGSAAGARRALSVVLDDAYARLWQVELPHGATRLADVEAAAALRFQSLYGEPATPWRSSRAWNAGAPFFCAVPEALLAQIGHAAEAAGLPLVAIVPQFVANWNRWQGRLAPQDWFGQLQGSTLRLGLRQDRRLLAVRALDVPADAGFDWLQQSVLREALLQGVAAPALLQLCGAVPPAWLAHSESAPQQLACRLLGAAGTDASASALLAQSGGQR